MPLLRFNCNFTVSKAGWLGSSAYRNVATDISPQP